MSESKSCDSEGIADESEPAEVVSPSAATAAAKTAAAAAAADAGKSLNVHENSPPPPGQDAAASDAKTSGSVWDVPASTRQVMIDFSSSSSSRRGSAVRSDMLHAIQSGDPAMMESEMSRLDATVDVVCALTADLSDGLNALAYAARSGSIQMYTAVLALMESKLSQTEVRAAVTTTNERGEATLVRAAVDGGSQAVFTKVVKLLDDEVPWVAPRQSLHGRAILVNAARDAARSGDLVTFKAVIEILDTAMTEEQAVEAVTAKDGGSSALTAAAKGDNRHVTAAWTEVLSEALPLSKMMEACTASFQECAKDPRKRSDGMSILIAHGAEVSSRTLVKLATVSTVEELDDIFLGGVSSVDNPLIPGMPLAATLEDAIKEAPADSDRRKLSALQIHLDDLLLEVLDRLPPKIGRVTGQLHGCASIFEPETTGLRPAGFRGPLRLALEERRFSDTYCLSPLMYQYMSHTFASGLPDAQDTKNLLGPAPVDEGVLSLTTRNGRDYLYVQDLVADTALGKMMQGLGLPGSDANWICARPTDWDKVFGGTLLPGGQFVAVGILTRPGAYFMSPVARMLFDFAVHVAMLVVYTAVVLESDETLSRTEMFLTFHVMAEVVNELQEMYPRFQEYWRDKWNWLEALSLVLLSAGLWIRIVDEDVSQGRAMFALSAPLVFSRILFFGQILPRQGIMIQVITIVIGELLQFAVVMGIIMMGFTVGFYALFSEQQPYGDTWLSVFKAMLGEVGVFDEFFDDEYGVSARLLLVAYLIITAVVLLNLLIAVLSTEHGKVEQVQERAFHESKVRIMKLYHQVTKKDILPAPFNLVQLGAWLLFAAADQALSLNTRARVKRSFGVTIFWLCCGPISLLVIWSLWVVSIPNTIVTVWKARSYSARRSTAFSFFLCAALIPFHLFCSPFIVLVLWIYAGFTGVIKAITRAPSTLSASKSNSPVLDGIEEFPVDNTDKQTRNTTSVAEMLKQAPDGQSVSQIREYLAHPATTAGHTHRRGELKGPATVDHVRRMANQFESTSRDKGEAVRAHLQSIDAAFSDRVSELERRVDDSISAIATHVHEQVDGLEDTMTARVERSLAAFELRLTELLKKSE